jgi:predicted amidohydrolase YtcJ
VPDEIFIQGNLFTADPSTEGATAFAVKGDRILAVGSDEDIRRMAGPATQTTDLEGAFVMPGLIDGHGHFYAMGAGLTNLNLLESVNWQEIIRLVSIRASQLEAGAWLEGRGWHQDKWSETPRPAVDGYPHHTQLSRAVPGHPVVLLHASGHALLANQRAMELAGVTMSTPDPPGGRIVRDAQGQPIGVFEENAMDLITETLERWKKSRSVDQQQSDFRAIVEAASAHCLKYGITSFQDAGSTFQELEWYRALADSGSLPVRLWAMVLQPGGAELERLSSYPVIGAGNHFFTCRAVKAYLDGALGSYGAWLLRPYTDKPDMTGQVITPPDTLALLAAACRDRGLQFCVHAIGDRANRELLDLFEQMLGTETGYGTGCRRWRVEHAQHVDPADQGRFARLGVIASVQTVHCTSDAPFVPLRLGADRAEQNAYPWRPLLDKGARIANGTDVPVEDLNPMANLYAAVTRRSSKSGVFPGSPLTRKEALYAYTIWNAWAAFEEQEKGSITTGKLADFAVFSDNLLQCGEDELLNARAVSVYVGGKRVHSVN